jgi:hypothetical protein
MAETLTIASPSFALLAPELGPAIGTPAVSKKSARPSLATGKNAAQVSDTPAVAKRKQSKSRNGTLPCSITRDCIG